MKGKTTSGAIILGVLVLSLLVEQIQVDAELCCPRTSGASWCRYISNLENCAENADCQIIDKDTCPPIPRNSAQIQVGAKELCCPTTFTAKCNKLSLAGTCVKTPGCHIIVADKDKCPLLVHSGAINEYCKLGCAFSVCNAISTQREISGDEEVLNEAVGQCNNACSAFCTKGSTVEIA